MTVQIRAGEEGYYDSQIYECDDISYRQFMELAKIFFDKTIQEQDRMYRKIIK